MPPRSAISMETAAKTFEAARSQPLVRGFVGGRVIFGETLKRWLAGEIDDAAAVRDLDGNSRKNIRSCALPTARAWLCRRPRDLRRNSETLAGGRNRRCRRGPRY